jgi:acyl-CoA thioesterase-1
MKQSIILAVVSIAVVAIGFMLLKPRASTEILPKDGGIEDKNKVVFLGDSITAGYGVESEQAFPYLIGEYWKENNISFIAVNEGISGDTTSGVLARLDNILTDNVYMVLVEIGANDAFAKTDVQEIKRNLNTIIERIQAKGIKVAIMEMDLPTAAYLTDSNYVKSFKAIYEEVGKECGIPVMPSLVREYENKSEMWQDDKIHPSPKGHAFLASNTLKLLNKNWVLKVE